MPKRWILVVDDSPLMLQMAEEMLRGPDFAITTAADAMQSFIQARDLRPVLVVSDIQMPGFGTGDLALRELRKDPALAKIPFIFVTGMDIEKARAMIPMDDPGVRLVPKPIDWVKLRAMIAEMTGLKMEED